MTGLTHLLHRTLANKYRIDSLIGRGGGAAVFLATHTEMNRTVAIKLLYPQKNTVSTRQRFTQEAKLVSQFKHPNTITVFDYGQYEENLYLVMEYIEGGSLDEYVTKHGSQSAKRTVEITLGILGSLEEAHYFGVLHRDLKPENIMLTQNFKGEWIPKVVDFGIAKVFHLGGGLSSGVQTQENSFIGTPRYTAPEQILSDEVSPSSDIYNVGLIMWFMLVGTAPVSSKKVKNCLRAHLSKSPWILPVDAYVPDTLAAIVHKALLKNHTQRYRSCLEMIEDLNAWLKQPTAQSTKTLQLTNAVIQELVEDIEDGDDWMFDQSHIVDPNVVHKSEWLGMSGSSFDLSGVFDPSFDDGLMEVSAPTVMGRQKVAQEPLALASLPKLHPSKQPQVTQPVYVSTQESEAPKFQMASSNSSLIIHKQPQFETQTDLVALLVSKKSAFVVLVGVILLGAIGVGWKLNSSENNSINPVNLALDSKVPIESPTPKKIIPSISGSRKSTSKFTVSGLLMVIRSQKWILSRSTDEDDLSSFRRRLYLFYKKDAKLEVTVFSTKNNSVSEQLMSQTQKPSKALAFENLVIRLHPLNKKASKALPSLLETFQKYRIMVLDHDSKAP